MADQIQVKLRKRLEAILKLPDNQVCADCKTRGPRWASANLGIFMCIECSGIHRNLGVHISFVRSVNLDSWTVKQVEFMEEWGNGRANAYYEANVPSHVVKPKSGDSVRSVEKYIRDKYEHKRYIAKTVPPKADREVVEEPVHEPVARRTSVVKQPVKRPETVFAAPAQQAPPPAAVNLIDFMDDPVATPASVASPGGFDFGSQGFNAPNGQQQQFQGQQQQFQGQQQQQQMFAPQGQQSGGFSAFDDSPRSQQNNATSNQDDFLSFVSAPAPVQQQQQQQQQQQFGFPSAAPPAVPTKPQASADSILSLYSNGGGAHHQQMGMMGGHHQQQQQQQFGGGFNNGFPPQGQGGFGGFPQGQGGFPQGQGGFPQGQGGFPQQQMHQSPQFQQQQQQQFGGFNSMQQQAPVHPFQQQHLGGPQMMMGQQQHQHLPTGVHQQPQYQQQQHQAAAPVNPFQQLQSFQQNPPQQQQNKFNSQQNANGGWR